MKEFECSGFTYRTSHKLSAMDQFHVTRRLGPALVVCGVTFKMMLEGVHVTLDHWAAVAGPVLEVVSHMSDEDAEYVIHTCMSIMERRDSGTGAWSPVMTKGERPRFMFDDIDMSEMLRLTVEVLRDNLVNFAKGMSVGGDSSASSDVPIP